MCQAEVDDFDHPAFYAPRQRIINPGDKPCPRKGKETVGPLCLCATHAKMARAGLVSEQGRVADRNSRRDVRNFPQKFPHGLHDWASKLPKANPE